MWTFLMAYFVIYGSMNLLFLLQARRAYTLSTTSTIVVGFLVGLMVFAPFITRSLMEPGYLRAASSFAFIGFTWMGLVFSFLVASGVLHLLMIPVASYGWWRGSIISLDQAARPMFHLACAYVCVVLVVGYLQADQVQLEERTISIDRFIHEMKPTRVVQISDLHLGLTTIPRRIRNVVDLTRAARPDLLVVTGDLLDGPILNEDEMAGWFREIEAPLGKYFILGNHEMYEGIEHAERFAKSAGLRLLRNEIVQVTDWLEIAGIDDPTMLERSGQKKVRDVEFLSERSPDRIRVYLKHRPVVEPDATDRFDLQLSGHTHSGQIYPFKYVTERFASHPCGLHRVGSAWFYHSRGSATWGPPIRFLTPPEVTLLHLTQNAAAADVAAD